MEIKFETFTADCSDGNNSATIFGVPSLVSDNEWPAVFQAQIYMVNNFSYIHISAKWVIYHPQIQYIYTKREKNTTSSFSPLWSFFQIVYISYRSVDYPITTQRKECHRSIMGTLWNKVKESGNFNILFMQQPTYVLKIYQQIHNLNIILTLSSK